MRQKLNKLLLLIFTPLLFAACYMHSLYWEPSMAIDPDFEGCFMYRDGEMGILIVQEPHNLLRGWGLGLGNIESDPEGGHPAEWSFTGRIESLGNGSIRTSILWGEPLRRLEAILQYDRESDTMTLHYVRDGHEVGPPRVLYRSTDCPEEWE